MMIFTAKDEGVRYGGLLKSRLIPYNEIRSIHIESNQTTVTTLQGEQIVSKSGNTLSMSSDGFYKHVVENNIGYHNETEIEDGQLPVTMEEFNAMSSNTCDIAKRIGDEIVRNRLGAEYETEFLIKGGEDMKVIYFYLKMNGYLVAMSDESKVDYDESEPLSFDNILAAYLVEWDPLTRSGKYGVTVEISNEEDLISYVNDSVRNFSEDFLEER